MKQNYFKEVNGRFKSEYALDMPLTNNELKIAIMEILSVEGFIFDTIEVNDEVSLFDGGIRAGCSILDNINNFLEEKLSEKITEITIFGKYNNTKIYIGILKNENLVRVATKENVDIFPLLKVF